MQNIKWQPQYRWYRWCTVFLTRQNALYSVWQCGLFYKRFKTSEKFYELLKNLCWKTKCLIMCADKRKYLFEHPFIQFLHVNEILSLFLVDRKDTAHPITQRFKIKLFTPSKRFGVSLLTQPKSYKRHFLVVIFLQYLPWKEEVNHLLVAFDVRLWNERKLRVPSWIRPRVSPGKTSQAWYLLQH